jgi:hypothetical protein
MSATSATPEPRSDKIILRPGFQAGSQKSFEGRLGLSFRINLWGSEHKIPVELDASFRLVREVTNVSEGKTTLVDRFASVEMTGKGGGLGNLAPVASELEKLTVHWTLGRLGVETFEARDQGPLLRKLKLAQTLRRLYELACRTPGRAVGPRAEWKDEKEIKASFSSVPLTLQVTAAYRYTGQKRCGRAWCAVVEGKESAILPDTQETKTRHRFEIGGLVKGRMRVMLGADRRSYRSWSIERVFALAASKKAKGKELTWGVRYEVSFDLAVPGQSGAQAPKVRARSAPRARPASD